MTPPDKRPPSLNTCKIIRAETWKYYWQHNSFQWHDRDGFSLCDLQHVLDQASRSPLRCLRITSTWPKCIEHELRRLEACCSRASWRRIDEDGESPQFQLTLG